MVEGAALPVVEGDAVVFELGQLLRGETRKEGVPQTAQIHLLLLLHAVAAVPGELFHFHRQ